MYDLGEASGAELDVDADLEELVAVAIAAILGRCGAARAHYVDRERLGPLRTLVVRHFHAHRHVLIMLLLLLLKLKSIVMK